MTERSISPDEVVAAAATGQTVETETDTARSLWSDAWRELRSSPLFWVSACLIALVILMALVPQLFTQTDPTVADLSRSREKPSFSKAWFGRDTQGYDIYARTIYGARASVLVGIASSILTLAVGTTLGLLSAYFGGWLDILISRLADIFFAVPLLLGGLLFLFTFPSKPGSPFLLVVGKVVLVLFIFFWPNVTRIMRSSVLQVKSNDYIQAARALGAGNFRIIMSHILPNAIAPVIVISTINLGVFIAIEATLSFLGIGLQAPAISWGIAISDASGIGQIRAAPHMLLFPSLFLSVTVLAFIMLGDAVRDAFDPKLR